MTTEEKPKCKIEGVKEKAKYIRCYENEGRADWMAVGHFNLAEAVGSVVIFLAPTRLSIMHNHLKHFFSELKPISPLKEIRVYEGGEIDIGAFKDLDSCLGFFHRNFDKEGIDNFLNRLIFARPVDPATLGVV